MEGAMSEIHYSVAWRRDDAELAAGALAFWKSIGLPANLAQERVPELCNVARMDGRVVGVTTVSLSDYVPVKCRIAMLRCAVAPEFRKHYLATYLTRDTLTIMEAWSLENPQEHLQGVGFAIQAEALGSKAVHPLWADWNTHYNLIGYTPSGEQMRLAWFRHAKLG
jgi:hypothetical protein